jgi:hypothetical protein
VDGLAEDAGIEETCAGYVFWAAGEGRGGRKKQNRTEQSDCEGAQESEMEIGHGRRSRQTVMRRLGVFLLRHICPGFEASTSLSSASAQAKSISLAFCIVEVSGTG